MVSPFLLKIGPTCVNRDFYKDNLMSKILID